MSFIKTVTRSGVLTKRQSFNLEVKCLRKLSENFTCICSQPRNHFPIIISTAPRKLQIKMSRVGTGIHLLNEINPPEASTQINCILQNMEKSGIIHKDLEHPANICYNKNTGDISLIDFGTKGSFQKGSSKYYKLTKRKLKRLLYRSKWTTDERIKARRQKNRQEKWIKRQLK